MRILRWLVIGMSAMLLGACDASEMAEKLLVEEEGQLARETVDTLASHDLKAIRGLFDEDMSEQMNEAWFAEYERYTPGRSVDGLRAIRVELNKGADESGAEARNVYSAWEWRSGDRFSLVELRMLTPENGGPQLMSFNVNSMPGPFDQWTSPRAEHAGVGHWLFVTLMVAAVVASPVAIWRIWRSGRFKRRVWWTLGALFGVGDFKLTWETGELELSLVSVQLFSAAMMKAGPFAPWVLTLSVPLIAIIAIVKSYRPIEEVTEVPVPA